MAVKKHILSFVLSLLLAQTYVAAQQELMLSQMPDQWQFNSINPAFFPLETKVALGLPGISISAYHSGKLSYNDFFKTENGQKFIDFDGVIQQLDPQNEIRFRQTIETVSVGFRLPWKKRSVLTLGHAIRFQADARYPKELVQLLWEGNAQFIGQTIEIAPRINAFDWHEIQLGLSRKFGPLRVGARAKYLMGISSLQTDPNAGSATIYTNPDIYQLEMNTNYGFYSSNIISAIDTNGLGFKLITNEFRNRIQSGSRGWAADVGGALRIGERFILHASALDLGGRIRWQEINYFKSQGSFEYDGVTIPGADIINGTDSLDFAGKLDSLNDIFGFQRSTAEDFETVLPARYYLGGSWQITKRIRIAGSLFHETRAGSTMTSYGMSAHVRPLRWVELGVLFAQHNRSGESLGCQLSLSPGRGRFFLASDNLLGMFTPYQSSRVSIRMGLSYLFSAPAP